MVKVFCDVRGWVGPMLAHFASLGAKNQVWGGTSSPGPTCVRGRLGPIPAFLASLGILGILNW